ncbi:MAG: hypothetical protein K2O01_03190 [Bacteroidales bacterium]|nr:hypothetical protein [Bacteroidales bacterium]
MNCFNHPDRPAVAQCPDCSKGLCLECATAHEQIICDNCFQKQQNAEALYTFRQIRAESKAIIREMVWSAILGIGAVIFVFLTTQPSEQEIPPVPIAILTFGIFAGIPAAWNALSFNSRPWKKKFKEQKSNSDSQPFIWFFLPFIFLYYFIILWGLIALLKLTIAFCIGIFILPFRLYRNIKRLNELKKLQAAYKNGH